MQCSAVQLNSCALQENSAEKEAAAKAPAADTAAAELPELPSVPMTRQRIPSPYHRTARSVRAQNATQLPMDRSVYGPVDAAGAKELHAVDDPGAGADAASQNRRVEHEPVAGVGAPAAEHKSEENARGSLSDVSASSKFSQLTPSPHYSSQTVSSRARSIAPSALSGPSSLAEEQSDELGSGPPASASTAAIKQWNNARTVSQQPLVELQRSPRSSQTASDEKLQFSKQLKSKDKARTLPGANAGNTPGRPRSTFALFKQMVDGSKSARQVGQLPDGRVIRPKTGFESLPD